MQEEQHILVKESGNKWRLKGTGSRVHAVSNTFMAAHDILEHQNGPALIGSIEDELEAFGAVWLLRGASGKIYREMPSTDEEVFVYYYRNMSYLYREYDNNYKTNKRKEMIGYDWLDKTVEESFKTIHNLNEPNQFEYFKLLAKHHMYIGFMKALNRFGKYHKTIFFDLEKLLKGYMTSYNKSDTITITITDGIIEIKEPKPSIFDDLMMGYCLDEYAIISDMSESMNSFKKGANKATKSFQDFGRTYTELSKSLPKESYHTKFLKNRFKPSQAKHITVPNHRNYA